MYIRIFPHIHVLKQRQHKRESVKLFLDPFGFLENPKLMPRKSKWKEGTTSYLDHETKERGTKINKPNYVLLFKSLGVVRTNTRNFNLQIVVTFPVRIKMLKINK